jgi:hypothetical protein
MVIVSVGEGELVALTLGVKVGLAVEELVCVGVELGVKVLE